MKRKLKTKWKAVLTGLMTVLMLAAHAVTAFADEVYEPGIEPYYEKSYNIFSYVILIGGIILGLMIVTGIVLLIIFTVRRKKRRKS